MNALGLGAVLVQAIGWSLVHFVWQAALVGALYAAARAVLPRGNPRYLAAMLALVVLAVLPVWTAWHEVQLLAQPVDLGNAWVTGAASAAVATTAATTSHDWFAPLRVALPWLVLAWACGVAFLGVRIIRQWLGLRAILRAAEVLPAWQMRAALLGKRLGLRYAVRVLASIRIATPTLVGWVRPVVVVPLAMLARLPVEQVDLILAHELAHLRRFDHLANLFQLVLETLLFYHPVVHWVSRDARNERELCCDALALRASGGTRRDFVAALAGLEEFRAGHADLALAASGGVLAERAWFIAGAMQERRRVRPGLSAVLLALLGALIALGVVWRQDAARHRIDEVLITNAAALRHDFTAVTERLYAPVLHGVIVQRQKLLPVALTTRVAPSPAAVALPRVMPVADMPVLSVSDLATGSLRVAPVFELPAVSASEPVESAVAVAPQIIRSVQPVYPPRALLNGVQGQVEIQFTLTATGVPQGLKVLRSPASGQFDAAALLALSQWRFTPPARPGRLYRQTFTFQLGGAAGSDAATARACLVRTGTHICRPVFDNGLEVGTSRPRH